MIHPDFEDFVVTQKELLHCVCQMVLDMDSDDIGSLCEALEIIEQKTIYPMSTIFDTVEDDVECAIVHLRDLDLKHNPFIDCILEEPYLYLKGVKKA